MVIVTVLADWSERERTLKIDQLYFRLYKTNFKRCSTAQLVTASPTVSRRNPESDFIIFAAGQRRGSLRGLRSELWSEGLIVVPDGERVKQDIRQL